MRCVTQSEHIRRIGNLFTDRDFDLGFLRPIAANCKRLQETGLDLPFVHGVERCLARTPPVDASAIQAVTPSDVFSWPGPAEHLTQSSERTGIENDWLALTGRVVNVKVEMDGDLHVALQDATGGKAGIVVTGEAAMVFDPRNGFQLDCNEIPVSH
jgi:hypothetical protein